MSRRKMVQGGNALGQPALNVVPLGAGNDAWQQVLGENPLCALLAAVDSECGALVEKRQVGRVFAAADFVPRREVRVSRRGT